MKDVECPYCRKELDINHDDGFGYEENVFHKMECKFCEKIFVFKTSISFHYEASKADCLNNSDHDYQLTHTFPREFSKMKCSMCGDERELTDEERINFKIGRKEDYFKKLNYNEELNAECLAEDKQKNCNIIKRQ